MEKEIAKMGWKDKDLGPYLMDTTYSPFIDFDPFEGIKNKLGPKDDPEDEDDDWEDDWEEDRGGFKEPKREDDPDRIQVGGIDGKKSGARLSYQPNRWPEWFSLRGPGI